MMADVVRPLEWPESQGALREMRALGVEISGRRPGSPLFHVISGRSERRWWLLPVCPRAVSAAAYGLFQPVLKSARVLTRAAVAASTVGLAKLTARDSVNLVGKNSLADLFPERCAQHFAYFSGTPGPHRKTVVQVMDDAGRILGYAKATCNADVAQCLHHEAYVLKRVGAAALRCGQVPRVLYGGAVADSTVLLTDTVKSGCMPGRSLFTGTHRRFLNELNERCASPAQREGADELIHGLQQRFTISSNALASPWRARVEDMLARIVDNVDLVSAHGLAHGDFTPWNSFVTRGGELYVFDWEYADWDYPADYDLIHFLSATPSFSRAPADRYLGRMAEVLTRRHNRRPAEARMRLLAYLCAHALRYACRVPHDAGCVIDWPGSVRSAVIIDRLLAQGLP